MAAQHGSAAQLETLVRGLRTVHENETPPLLRAERESVSQSWTSDSQWALSARLPEIALAALADGRARPLTGEEQAAIVVHVDAACIQQPEPADGAARPAPRSAERGQLKLGSAERAPIVPMGRVADGPGLPTAVVERLACIGRVRLAVRDGGKPHSDVLCEMHPQAHHHGEFTTERLGRGKFRFWRDGRELPAWIDPSALITDPTPIENEHADVAATAATPRWDGTRKDHDWAITTAAQHLNLPASA